MTIEPENKPDNDTLHERIDQLENRVSSLQEQLDQILTRLDRPRARTSKQGVHPQQRAKRETAVSPPPPLTPPTAKPYLQGDFWLNKIGIGLMLFALAFLFKFAVDQGWLTPAVRVVIGLLLATTLLILGLRVHKTRHAFSVVLLGGSMASYYITGFAAFQLYELVSFPIAFVFMFLVTMLTFTFALHQDEAILALIGALGGFITPFLLYTGGSNVQGLIFYTCILIGGTITIYFYRGWRVLLWTATTLGWIVMWIGEETVLSGTAVINDKIAIQTGLLFAWFAFWGVPLFRQYVYKSDASTLRPLSVGIADDYLPRIFKQWADLDLHVYTITAVFLFLASSIPLWELEQTQTGWLFIGFALLYGFIALNLYRTFTLANLGITHGITATLLLTIAFIILLENEALLIALTAELLIWHFFNHRLQNNWVEGSVHLFSGIVAMWMLVRLLTGETTSDITAVRILVDVAVILSFAGIALAWLSSFAKRLYLLAIHIAILLLFWRELSDLTNGQGLVSISWGIYAVVLLLIGLRYQITELRMVGLATLFILVGKLFLIDLSEVKPVWRILLFFGFGGVFLLLSYFYQTLWRSKQPTEKPLP